MNIPTVSSSKVVASQNDKFRKQLLNYITLFDDYMHSTETIFQTNSGIVKLSDNVSMLDADDKANLLRLFIHYDDFSIEGEEPHGDDPYGEHDFGVVDTNTGRYYFKIDYFDNNYEYHSPNKEFLTLTKRVLTVLEANEY